MLEDNSPSSREKDLLHLEAQIVKHDFLTEYIVRIGGRYDVHVHGKQIRLDSHGFVIFVLLTEEAIAHPGSYIPTETLNEIIETSQARLGALNLGWTNSADTFYKAILYIRQALKNSKLNPALIEAGRRGQGYRLSTPSEKILMDPAFRIRESPPSTR